MSQPTATPFWFGPEDRRLFGWLHSPDGPARGAVVLCYPIGYEQVCAYRTYVVVARRLAARGFLVLRFDYDGTGDSVGSQFEPDRVAAWCASIDLAVDELRSRGATTVALAGMRVGATLAATVAARRDDVDALVLWDPCASGRAYVREAMLLLEAGVGAQAPDGTVEVAGQLLTRATIDELGEVDLRRLTWPPAPRTLVLSRSDRRVPAALQQALASDGVEVVEAVGQAELLDSLSVDQAEVPEVSVDAVVQWLDDTSHGAITSTDPRQTPDVAVVGWASPDVPVLERAVALGPIGLFGIVTETAQASGPPIICLNYGAAHHIGPNRLWVDAARQWAAEGFRVTRVDISGIGDSPVHLGQPEHRIYAPEAIDDLIDVATALSPDDPHDVVTVGVCSGAYLSIDVGASFGLRGICAINPNLRYKPAELFAAEVPHDPRRALPATRPMIRALKDRQYADAIQRRLPPSAWYALDRLGVHSTPAKALERLADRGTDIYVAFGDGDYGLFILERRGAHPLRKLRRRDDFRLDVVDGMDHLLMLGEPRNRLAERLTAHLVERFGPARSPGGTDDGRTAETREMPTMDSVNRATWSRPESRARYAAMQGWSDAGEAELLHRMRSAIASGPVLDIGVGNGRTTSLLRLVNDDYTAVDYTPEMVTDLQQRYPDVTASCADARDLSAFGDEQFGFVYFSYNGIDVVSHEDRARIFDEVHRVLRPEGVFAFSTFMKTGSAYHEAPWRGEPSYGSRLHRCARWIGRLPFTLPRYERTWRNWWTNRRLESDHGDWAIHLLNLHECGVLAHFTTLDGLRSDLKSAGFELTEVLDSRDGTSVPLDAASTDAPWVHVAAIRR